MTQIRAKKSLGQHFLTDLGVAQRIAASLALDKPCHVLEIGPGMGVLTQYLEKDPNIRLTCVELDHEAVTYLHRYFPRVHVIEDDFLRLDLSAMFDGEPFCVIGNYPYNISSQIFFRVLDHRDRIPVCSGMIQKEVAERMASGPGSKAYGILSVLLQAYYDIEYLFTVGREVFEPMPKVQSAVVRLKRNDTQHLACDERLFRSVVKTAFNQRRKTMRNSLQTLIGKGHPLLNEPIFQSRPEQLSVNQFVELTNLIDSTINIKQ